MKNDNPIAVKKHHNLIKKLVDKTITKEERKVLESWVLEDTDHQKIFTDKYETLVSEKNNYFDDSIAYDKFINKVSRKEKKLFTLKPYYKYAAIFLLIACLGYLILPQLNNNDTTSEVVANTINDITIKLSDGTTKVVSSGINESIKDVDGNIIANSSEDKLVFGNTTNDETLKYNEINVPNGRKLKIELSDGTLVWLNSGTYFKFPQNFTMQTENRLVYLNGEAYFDVATNKNKPFIVDAKGVNVEVLGTQFNVSSYQNETNIATTLVEGSVNVYQSSSPINKLLLVPNYQARYNKSQSKFSEVEVDTRMYTNWIHDKLIIDNLKFDEIIKKLERKFDVEITNQATKLNNEAYKGEFENESLEAILTTIALSNHFNFKIEGNKIIITE